VRKFALFGAAAATLMVTAGVVVAQEGIGRNDPNGNYRTLSDNVKLFGGFDFAESCTYDPGRDLLVVPNMGNRANAGTDPNGVPFHNDGWVSLINHDGSVNTFQWLTSNDETGAFINDPFGSDIVNGVLYINDRTGGTGPDDPLVAAVTMWDVASGAWIGYHSVPDSTGFNDLAVTDDGVIYATESSDPGRIFKIEPDGTWSIFVEGDVLSRPNGIAIDPDGNIVQVSIGSTDVLTFSPAGELLKTEHSVDGGDDGLVIMADGTKYVSSVRFGSVSMIPPGGEATLIAVGMPSGASMCYDPTAHNLVVPMNNSNALAIIPIGM
jgi:hypothetical protein